MTRRRPPTAMTTTIVRRRRLGGARVLWTSIGSGAAAAVVIAFTFGVCTPLIAVAVEDAADARAIIMQKSSNDSTDAIAINMTESSPTPTTTTMPQLTSTSTILAAMTLEANKWRNFDIRDASCRHRMSLKQRAVASMLFSQRSARVSPSA